MKQDSQHIVVDLNNILTDSRGMGRYVRTVLRLMIQRHPEVRWTAMTRIFPAWRVEKRLRTLVGHPSLTVANRVPNDAHVMWHPWNSPVFPPPLRNVVTMHDAVPFVYPPQSARAIRREQEPFRLATRVANRILTVSHFAKGEIHRWLGYPLEQITVSPLGVEAHFVPGAAQLPDKVHDYLQGRPYILTFGAPDARKNLETLYRAWCLAYPGQEVALVGTGFDLQTTPGVLHLERTHDDALLLQLYRGAEILAYPSVYEGFGLPVIEAMAAGAPVIAVRGSSVAEVGGDAAFWVAASEATDPHVWAAALRRLHEESGLRRELSVLGLAQARHFTWEATARTTFAALSSVAV